LKGPHQVHQHQNQKALDGARLCMLLWHVDGFGVFSGSFFMDLLHAWPKFFDVASVSHL